MPPERVRAILGALFAPQSGGLDPERSGTAQALATALDRARAHGWVALPLGLHAVADARELAGVHAAIALQGVRHGRPSAPTAMVSAGPVRVAPGADPAAQFLLALALSLDEHSAIYAYALGPGSGGGAPGAGYFMAPATVARAARSGWDPGARLLAGEAAALFAQLGDAQAAQFPGSETDVLRVIFLTPE
jgi:glycerate 2-kinase